MELQNNLRRYRFDAGEMTQQALADALGVSRQTVHAIEKGKFNPSVKLALQMAHYFNSSVENIFQLKIEKEKLS
ncbi:helix-turn-helix transcriptional regulator [bacterium]|nr:helix-turn-helix transcriptional regulator [bacterium]